MAVVSAPDIRAVKPAEVLAFGAKTEKQQQKLEGSGVSADLKEAARSGKKLRELQEKGATGRQIYEAEAATPSRTFSALEREGLVLKFGAGKAVKEGGKLKITDEQMPDDVRIDCAASLERADKASAKIDTFLRYTEVQQEADRTGKKAEDIMAEKGIKGNWTKIRQQALDSVIELGILKRIAPDLQNAPEEARRIYIESVIATDPKLQAEVGARMSALAQEARNLPDVEEDSELKAARERKGASEKQKEGALNEFVAILAENGYGLNEGLAGEIRTLVDQGKSSEFIVKTLGSKVFNRDSFSEIDNIRKLQAAKQELDNADKRYQPYVNSQRANPYEAEYKETRNQYDELKRSLMSNQEFQNQWDTFNELNSLLTGEAAQALSFAAKANRDLAEANKTIVQREQQAEKKARPQRAERLRQESELTDKMEQVLAASVSKVLTDRFDEVQALRNKEIDEASEKSKSEGVKRVGEMIKTRWISYDEKHRDKVVRRDNIGEDIKFLLYHGKEDGIKRLMLKELRGAVDVGPAAGNKIYDGWKIMDLDSLSPDVLKTLNEAYAVHGKAFEDKLVSDFFAARGLFDTTLGFGIEALGIHKEWAMGELALKEHEWTKLRSEFGQSLEQALKGAKGGEELLKSLEQQGVPPSILKKKGLTYILLALLGGVGALAATPFALAGAGAGALGYKQTFGF